MPSMGHPPTAASPTPADDIAYLDAASLVRHFRARTLSPIEVAQALIERIAAVDGPVNAIVHVDPGTTLAMARAAEARYRAGAPLSAIDGVPITVKDLSHVAGWPRRRGSRALLDAPPSAEDTPCVARLREAGAVLLAKTATPEAGCKIVTRSPVHGVTANPYDLTKTPGGSSGGAAAALAMGLGPLAVGSDGAGSIRIPACHTNVVGLKPGFGRVPAFPPDIDMPHSVVGPMARTVADAALMLDVMSTPEPRDPFAWPVPFVPPADLADPDLTGLRIALSPRLGCIAPLADAEVDALVASAGPLLAAAGAELVAAAPEWPVDPFEPFMVLWETGCALTVDAYPEERRPLVDPLIREIAERGRRIDLPSYLRAVEQRLALTAAARRFFNGVDLAVGPVMPVPAYDLGRDMAPGYADADWRWCPYTYPWNMTGQPAASIPIGFTRAGLPVGIQVIGPAGSEATILRAAAAIERRTALNRIRPPRPS